MVVPYIIISMLFYIMSAFLIINPGLIKFLLVKMVEKKLVMVYGVIEILISLGILYYRGEATYMLIPIIIGFMLFIDGIMYVILSNKQNKLLYLLLQMKKKSFRRLSFITLFAAIGLSFAGLPKYL